MPSRRAGSIAALAAAIAVLAPFLVLVMYAHPQNDDWAGAVSSMHWGVLDSMWGWLNTWTGRYTGLLLSLLTPLALGSFEGWRAALAAYLLAVPLGTWALVTAIAPASAGRLSRIAVAACATALLYGWMPSPATGLYWFTGVVCYTLGEGTALAAVACVVRGERAGVRQRWGWTALAAVLTVFSVGTNEPVAMLIVGTLSVVLVVAAARRRPVARIAVVLAIAAAALAAVLLAPGTLRRMAVQRPPEGRVLLVVLGETLALAGRSALRWCVTTPIAPAALLLGLVAARARTQDERWTFPHPILVVPVAAAAYLGTVLAPVYGQAGTEIPAHTMNLLFHAFCAAVLLSGASIGAWLGARPPGPARRAGSARRWLAPAGAVAVAALAVLPASSARTAWLDLVTGKAGRWDAAMEERYRIVARCLPVCDVPRIADGPETLAWFEDAVDEATDSPFWLDYKDSKYALFFEKYRIRLAAGRAGGSSP